MISNQTADTRSFLIQNRTLCEGDNLEFLLRMPDESVDLIATDPPFNKNREFQGIGRAEGQSFKDYWSWEADVHKPYLDHITKHWPALYAVVQTAYQAHSPSVAAFLAFMSVRLIEMHRVLKPTGSIYLHCDSAVNAYLRLVLDAIFGKDNFRNEIVWRRDAAGKGAKRVSNQFPRNSDFILFYSKSASLTYNQPYNELSEQQKQTYRYVESSGRKYKAVQLGDYSALSIERMKENGLIHTSSSGKEYKKYYLDEAKSTIDNIWTDIAGFGTRTSAKERIGWATQKPLALYRRIIEASSNEAIVDSNGNIIKEADLVLDPFCGCATTCVAAEQLGRRWIGIDLSPLARSITLDRLAREAGAGTFWPNEVHTVTTFDLAKLPGGTTAMLAIPQLPDREHKGMAKGYKAEDVRRYLAAREAVGTAKHHGVNMACQGCGYLPPRLDYQDVDHIIPQAKEGKSSWDNLCLLCGPCNRRKAHKLTIEQLRIEVEMEGLILDKAALMPMDPASIAKRDRALRPPQQ